MTYKKRLQKILEEVSHSSQIVTSRGQPWQVVCVTGEETENTGQGERTVSAKTWHGPHGKGSEGSTGQREGEQCSVPGHKSRSNCLKQNVTPSFTQTCLT